mmetsp:Transcript_5180/g.17066  ORF Transcript_5180/g.17066 Transcript_5180/m.17066 type:complete len:186 (-) Transcript_5180:2411-2968(-)
MKFGKLLRTQIEAHRPELKSKFLAYKDLKKQLKAIVADNSHKDGSAPSVEPQVAPQVAEGGLPASQVHYLRPSNHAAPSPGDGARVGGASHLNSPRILMPPLRMWASFPTRRRPLSRHLTRSSQNSTTSSWRMRRTTSSRPRLYQTPSSVSWRMRGAATTNSMRTSALPSSSTTGRWCSSSIGAT